MFDIALIVGVVMTLTQLIKQLDHIPSKYLPIVSLLIGLIAGFIYVEGAWQEQLMYGLMIGLSASGLFDQSKIVTKKGEGK